MPTGVDGAVPISEVLGGPWLLTIPDYQRDYSWDGDDCKRLVEDLRRELTAPLGTSESGSSEPQHYFLGTIILSLSDADGEGNGALPTAEIVDGQQRLATLTMLIACLRDLAESAAEKDELDRLIRAPIDTANGSPAYALTLRGADGTFLKTYVQPRDATRIALPKRSLKRRLRIVAARNGLQQALAPLTALDRQQLSQLIAGRCRVAVVKAHGREQAWKIFARVNQRGKRLANGEILKAVVIGALPEAERARTLALWEKHQGDLGADFEGDAIGRRYLFNYIAERQRSGSILESVIAQVETLGPRRFMDEVFDPVARAYLAARQRKFSGGTAEQNARISALLTVLSWQPDDAWITAAIPVLIRHAANPDLLIAELGVLDRFMYGQMLLKRNQHKLKIYEKLDRLEQAVASFASPAGEATLAAILRFKPIELRMIRDALEYGLSSGPAKAVLARILLETGEKTLGECDAIVASKKWEVEHFVPKSPQGGNTWQAVLGPGKSIGQYAKKLGNLYLAPMGLNRQLDNLGFTQKLETLARQDPKGEQMLPRDVSLLAGGWDAARLDERHGRLTGLAVHIWSLDAESASELASPSPRPRANPRRSKRRVKKVEPQVASAPDIA